MHSILHSLLLRLSPDEILHDLQLFLAALFKSAEVMENISIMTREDEFVVDVK